MASGDLLVDVREEIEALHRFFAEWFSGAAPEANDIFEQRLVNRLDPQFVLIPPAGTMMSQPELAQGIRTAYGSNPSFRIAIRNVSVRDTWPGHVLVTYEEWQRNALASTPPDNGRVASAIFRRAEGLKWLHVHETWLPKTVMEAGPYDF